MGWMQSRRTCRLAMALGGLLLAGAEPSRAALTRYVDSLHGDDALDGLAAAVAVGHGPKATIQAAIAVAGAGDTIVVHPGVYPETVHFPPADLTLTSRDPADPSIVAATVISGAPDALGVRRGVNFADGPGPDAVLTGFTVSTGAGRGITCSNGATPTISHCILRGNLGDEANPGGALLCVDSAPILRHLLICGNASSAAVGGMELVRSSPRLINCTLTDNHATAAAGPRSGGLLCQDSSPVLRNCIFWGNTASATPDGPQIVCNGLSAPALSYCCIEGGLAAGAPGASGGEGNQEADPLFADSASGDYRLRSSAGRWDGSQWVLDDVSSPALDAGDPTDDASVETVPNGGRVNLGFDGNTPTASRSAVPPLAFVIEPATLVLTRDGTAAFAVSLSRPPAGPLAVTLRLDPVTTAISLTTGPAFTLGPADWVTGVIVELEAPADAEDTVSAEVAVWIEAAGMEPAAIRVRLANDDVALSLSGGTPTGTTVHERGAPVRITAQPPEHWRFVRWEGDIAGIVDPLAASTVIQLNTPAVVDAQFALDRHSLVIHSTEGAPQGAGEYDYGDPAVWSVSSPLAVARGERRVADPAGAAVIMDADRTITVAWRTEYLLTTAASGPGGVDTGSGWHAAGTTARLTAVPERGAHFRGWTGDLPRACAADNPLTLTMDQPRTFTAEFAPNPLGGWAAVTVNQPRRPGAAAAWLEASPDAAGGWQSDLSIIVPPEAPVLPLAYCRAWPFTAPEGSVGGDFERDTPGRLPQGWLRCPQWPTERCLVIGAAPLFPGHARSLRLTGAATGPQGLVAPRSALHGDAVVQFALYLPESLAPESTLVEVWHNGIGVALRSTANGLPCLELGNRGAWRLATLNQPPALGAWNVVTLFQWSRSDADADGLDDGWEKLTFHGLGQTGTADTDDDGLSNETEYRLGTTAADPDSDHDGMRDGWETDSGLDPLADDAGADPDHDHCPNLLEARLGTDPHLADAPLALFSALPNLASFWPLAESLDNRLAAALSLCPSGQTSIADKALFLQALGSAAQTALPAAQAAAAARTLALWFRSAGGGMLLSTSGGDGSLPAASLRLDANGQLTATVVGAGPDGASARWELTVEADPALWHHVVLACPDSGAPALFLDGVQVSGPRNQVATVLLKLAPWEQVCVGNVRAASPDPSTPVDPFRGWTCGLAWFTEALSAEAVQQLCNAGRALALDALLTLDLDVDGLPDGWEYSHFGSLDGGAQDDPDHDGLADAAECRLGSDPTVPDSDGDGLSDGAEVQTHGTDPTRPDTDGDGLPDGLEVTRIGSDPRLLDTDGDGLADGWEVAHGLSPLRPDSTENGDADALADLDRDGLSNAAEMAQGTDPSTPDVGSSTVTFTTPATAVREINGTLHISLSLSECPPDRDTVTLVVACTGGSARRGTDYEFADTPVTFSRGHLSAVVEIRLLADVEPEAEETIILAFEQVTGAHSGPYATHLIRIVDAVSPADDSDADGLPDVWEMRYFSTLEQGATGDSDHDGLSNLEEYRCGARPDHPYRVASADELGLRVTGMGR